jgi:hypothetical protein
MVQLGCIQPTVPIISLPKVFRINQEAKRRFLTSSTTEDLEQMRAIKNGLLSRVASSRRPNYCYGSWKSGVSQMRWFK